MTILDLSLQIIGAITGIIAVYLNAKQHPYAWWLSIFGAIASIVVYEQAGLYSEIILQAVFIALSIQGFVAWKKTKADENSRFTKNANSHPSEAKYLLSPSYLSFEKQQFLVPIILVLTLIFCLVNKEVTTWLKKDFQLNFSTISDALVTSISLVATYLLAKKKMENWLLWYLANIVSIALFFQKGLLVYTALYFIYWLLGIYGWRTWLKAYKLKS